MKRFSLTLVLTLLCAAAGWRLGAAHRKSAPSSAQGSVVEVSHAPTPPSAASVPAESGEDLDDAFRLLALSPDEWSEALREAFLAGRNEEAEWLARRWAARDPKALFAFMTAPDGLGFSASSWPDWSVTQVCFAAWLRSDPAAALEAAKALPQYDPHEGKTVYPGWHAILPELFKYDPAQAMRLLGEYPGCNNGVLLDSGLARSLARAAAGFPESAARPWFLQRVLQVLCHEPDGTGATREGEERAAAWLAGLPPAARLETVRGLDGMDAGEAKERTARLLKGAFTEAELKALASGAKGKARETALNSIARLRALKDPSAAARWASAELEGLERHQAMTEILRTAVPENPKDMTGFVAAFAPGPLRDSALGAAVRKLLDAGSFQSAGDWILTLPEETDRKNAAGNLAGNWARNRPEECAAWILKLPEGPTRVQTAAAAVSTGNFNEQLEFAARLPEPLALEALDRSWQGTYSDSRPLAEAAARLPAGPVRELAMEKASRDSSAVFKGYNQAWLDWAAALPTEADRAAALKGAEKSKNYYPKWEEGIEEAARARLAKTGSR